MKRGEKNNEEGRKSMRTRTVILVTALAVLLAAPAAVLAQSASGSIFGTVFDADGGALPGVTVTAANVATGTSRMAISTGSGTFSFPLLAVGRYTVKAELSGFKTMEIKDVAVTVGGQATVRVTLELAGVQAAVTVTGEAPLIETTRSQDSSVVGDTLIATLPTNGRNFIDFVLTTPGVVRDVRLGDISFAGQRGTMNSLVVDGADNNNTFFGQTLGRTGSGRAPYQFSQDAVKEFQVNRNAYSAEYGRAGGAVINVVTKSGTNELHGGAFFFKRDKSLNAIDYIDRINNRPKAPYKYDQFGLSLGGPVMKDKLFFFVNYDGQRNTIPNTVVLTIPSGTPTDADTLAGIEKARALANSWERRQDQDVFLAKLDWEASSDERVSFRYNRQNFTGKNFENGGITNAEQHTGNSLVTTDTYAGNVASVFSSALFNELRGQFAKDKEPGEANSALPEGVIRQGGQNILTVGRNSFSPRETTIERFQIADTFTAIFGSHTVKTGFDYNRDNILNYFPGNFFGSYTFQSFADWNRGVPSSYTQAFAGAGTTGGTTHPDLREYAAFVQDEWRVASNLTVNAGLRYDLQKVAQPSTRNPDAQLAAAGLRTDQINEDKNNYGIRTGLAWTVDGTGKTVLRAGYGVFYGRTPSIMYGTAHSNNGINVQTFTLTGSAVPTYPNVLTAPPVGVSGAKPTIFVFDPNFEQPRTQQGSLGIEHALTDDLAVNVSYQWVKGTDLPRSADINLGTASLVTIPIASGGTATVKKYGSDKPFSNFNRVIQFQSSADSEYNGFTLEFIKRMTSTWTGRLAYTYGQVKDNRPDATAVVPFSAGDDGKYLQDPKDPQGDWAWGDNDVRHRIVLSGLWNLGAGSNLKSGFMRALLSDWSLSGIVTFQTGQPYSARVLSDLNGDGNLSNDRAPGFARNTERLPSIVTFDPRISRRIGLGGTAQFEIIAEAFNVFNASNVSGVRTTYYSLSSGKLVKQTNFGTPTSSLGPRIIQLAAKLSF